MPTVVGHDVQMQSRMSVFINDPTLILNKQAEEE